MKKIVSLSVFIFVLILNSSVLLSLNLNLKSSESLFMKEKITINKLNSKNQANNNSFLFIKQNTPSSYPNFNNKGFKCVKTKRITTTIDHCEFGRTCEGKGVIVYGPDENGDMLIKFPHLQSYKCTTEFFSLKNVSSIKCYSYKPVLTETLKSNETININKSRHAFCALSDTSVYTFVKQLADFTCESSSFKNLGSKKIEPFVCTCIEIYFPNDKTLKPVFTPMRLSGNSFQCLRINATIGSCISFKQENICSSKLEQPVKSDSVISLNPEFLSIPEAYYFDRWICPYESGLNVAVQFAKIKNGYMIQCLSRRGEDCFYDELANEACKRIKSCNEEKIKGEFNPLTCGDANFVKLWGHNGFNTYLPTWGKEANAWLRFDATIQITGDKLRGEILLPNGLSACVPDTTNESECLKQGENNAINKVLNKYDEEPTLFKSVLLCGVKAFPDSKTNSSHWCGKALISPNNKGEFSLS